MNQIVDARGLSCPQPVLMTLNELKRIKTGTLLVRVDTETAVENVSRAAGSQGWGVKEVEMVDDEYKITLRKS